MEMTLAGLGLVIFIVAVLAYYGMFKPVEAIAKTLNSSIESGSRMVSRTIDTAEIQQIEDVLKDSLKEPMKAADVTKATEYRKSMLSLNI